MSMCSTCKAEYDQYSGLMSELNNAFDQVEECKTTATNTKTTLSSVIICGVGIDKEDTSTIIRYLGLLSNGLSTLITQCSHEMSFIDNNCPGSHHYDDFNQGSGDNQDGDGSNSS